MNQIKIIQRQADVLLDDFGAGKSTPGAGSAAAFSAALAASLALTVSKITLEKNNYIQFHDEAKKHKEDLQLYIATLKELFEEDSKIFSDVIDERKLRDNSQEETEKNMHRDKELELMKRCTDIPLDIADLAIKTFYISTSLLDHGYQATRGDSCTAASLCVAAAHGCTGIVRLNLVKFTQNSEWKTKTQERLNNSENILSQCAETLVNKIRQIEPG